MYKKAKDGQSFSIPGGTKGIVYELNAAHSLAYVEIDGIYPVKGVSLNDICTETIYLLEGQMKITCDGVEQMLTEKGDVFAILPGKKYSIEGKGKALDFITPGWDKKQNHIIE